MSAAVIESFADKRTAAIYKGIAVRSLHPDVQKRARLKLMVLEGVDLKLTLRSLRNRSKLLKLYILKGEG